jgi:hypothetical protein
MSMTQHLSYYGRLKRAATRSAGSTVTATASSAYRPISRYCERACCCTARPAVVAIIPPGTGRGAPADLLLCGHHYRKSRAALAARSATFLDMNGCVLPSGAWPELPATP